MAKGHDLKERKLLDDIRLKNGVRKKLDQLESRRLRFSLSLTETRKPSKKARLEKSLSRYGGKIKELTQEVVRLNKGLLLRIKEELKVSEKEVTDFQKKYKKELKETLETREQLKKTRDQKPTKILSASVILRRIALLEKKLQKEKKEDSAVKKEIDSEALDKIKLNLELRRSAAELAHYESEVHEA